MAYLDQLADVPIQLDLALKLDAGFSLKDFVEKDGENFYNLFTKNFNFEFILNTSK